MKLKALFRTCWKLIQHHWIGLCCILSSIFGGMLGVKFKLTYIAFSNNATIIGNTVIFDFILGVLFFFLALLVIFVISLLVVDMLIPVVIQIKNEAIRNYQAELASLQSNKKNTK